MKKRDKNAERNTAPMSIASDEGRQLHIIVSRLSLAFIAAFVLMILLTAIFGAAGIDSGNTGMDTPMEFIITYLPFFLAILLIARKFPMMKYEQQSVQWPEPTVSQVISWILVATGLACICAPSMIRASVWTIQLAVWVPKTLLFSSFTGVLSFATLGVVVIGPILEEYIFRRLIQDKLLFWGEGTAIVLSSILFSLGHVSFGKIIGTFVSGLVLGYIHAKTGKMRWNIILHMSINALSVLIDCLTIVHLYVCASMIYALIYLIRKRPWKNLLSGESGMSGRAKAKACMINPAFWICIVCYLALMAMNIYGA